MRISDIEVKKILSHGSEVESHPLVEAIVEIGHEADRKADAHLVKEVVKAVVEMPDRAEMIADLRARIESGEYNPSSEEIVETMIRRTIADQVR